MTIITRCCKATLDSRDVFSKPKIVFSEDGEIFLNPAEPNHNCPNCGDFLTFDFKIALDNEKWRHLNLTSDNQKCKE